MNIMKSFFYNLHVCNMKNISTDSQYIFRMLFVSTPDTSRKPFILYLPEHLLQKYTI